MELCDATASGSETAHVMVHFRDTRRNLYLCNHHFRLAAPGLPSAGLTFIIIPVSPPLSQMPDDPETFQRIPVVMWASPQTVKDSCRCCTGTPKIHYITALKGEPCQWCGHL